MLNHLHTRKGAPGKERGSVDVMSSSSLDCGRSERASQRRRRPISLLGPGGWARLQGLMGWERVAQEAQGTFLPPPPKQDCKNSCGKTGIIPASPKAEQRDGDRSWSLQPTLLVIPPPLSRSGLDLCLGKEGCQGLFLSPFGPACQDLLRRRPVGTLRRGKTCTEYIPGKGMLAHRVTEPSGPVSSLCLSASRPLIHVFNADFQTNNIALTLCPPSHL